MMKNENLSERLNKLGYPLFEVEANDEAGNTLADVVKSKDRRLWEGFPVLLANSAERGLFDYDKVKRHLKKSLDKANLVSLVAMSLALYKTLDLKFSWADKFYKSFSKIRKRKVEQIYKNFKKNLDFKIANYNMSAQRLKHNFNYYFNEAQSRMIDLVSMREQSNLEYSLSQIFSPKQKEILWKKLKREKLTKTEKEYFSRVIKKKVSALANPELYRLAQGL